MIAVLGSFDGFHIGHRMLFEKAAVIAEKTKDSWSVVTFSPHPQSVLSSKHFPVLYTEPEKDILANCMNIPEIVRIPFSRALSEMEPSVFVDMLEKSFFIRGIVVGDDFRFGKGRSGDTSFLEELVAARGWDIEVLPQLCLGDLRVSSTAIREKVASGDIVSANSLLGYPFSVAGTVIHGDGRGRLIGFPTINLDIPAGKIIPARGVYSGCVVWKGSSHPAAVNIGLNPTFPGERNLRCEAYIPGFRDNLYGEWINLSFFRRVRGEKIFESAASLVEQMKRDIQESLVEWEGVPEITLQFLECLSPLSKGH